MSEEVIDPRREAYLRKVRALLTQAEDEGCTPDEAKAFSEKAQDLMEKYSLSQIELELVGARQRDAIECNVTFFVEGPYVRAKQDLWFRIALANGCKMVVSSDCKRRKYRKVEDDSERGYHTEQVFDSKGNAVKGGQVFLTGFRSDIDNVELLYTSLLVQATNEVLHAEKESWENTRSFRNAFLYGYAGEIGSRLRVAKREAQTAEAETFKQSTGSDLLPVLASRVEQVEQEYKQYYGKLGGSVSFNYKSGTGYSAGRAAGGRANVGNAAVGGRRSLGR